MQLNSVTRIINVLSNKHSFPVARKREQKLISPYWILVNELTLNSVLKVINVLNKDMKDSVLDEFINVFTNFSGIKDHAKRKGIQNILNDIGTFRNSLAHNQPIFSYNIDSKSLLKNMRVKFYKPQANKNKKTDNTVQINNIKQQICNDLNDFFGYDSYNGRGHSINLSLSYIIYLINNLLKCSNTKTDFKNELQKVYSKYGLFVSTLDGNIKDYNLAKNSKETIDRLSTEIIKELSGLNNKLRNIDFRTQKSALNKKMSEIKKEIKKIQFDKEFNVLDPVINIRKYIEFTEVDSNFLLNVLK